MKNRKKLKIFKMFRNLMRNMSFQQKISIIVFISIFLPCILISVLTYKGAVDALTKQTVLIVKSHTTSTLSDIDTSLSAAVGINNDILKEDKLIDYSTRNQVLTEEEKSKYYPELYNLFNSYISQIKAPNILRCLHSYYLYLPSQKTVITTDSTYYENIAEDNMDFVKKLAANEYFSSWYPTIPVTYDSVYGKNSNEKLISYVLPIYNSENNDLAAVCALNVSTALFDDLYEDSVGGVNNNTYIFDKDGKVVDSNMDIDEMTDDQRNLLFQNCSNKNDVGEFNITIGQQNYYVVYSSSNFTGWKCATLFNKNDIVKQLNQTRIFMIVMILISVMFIFILSTLLAQIFQTPLKKLTNAMKQVQKGNFKAHINDKRQDEYQLIYSVFNSMTDELEWLVQNLETEQMLNKESKIRLLQEQINPHFLYNTLDSIYSIAKIQKIPEISNMVMALSKFFRASLSEGKDIVPLSDAIGLVESYLTVQNIRFKGKVQFKVSASEELLGYMVPKLVLQPFVENSVYHGIEKKKEEGSLIVRAEEREGCLYLKVLDDGIGMPEEKLIEIQKALQDNLINESGNFAIKNLNNQIKLRYGNEYGISIDSTEGKGTIVLIKLPVIRNWDELGSKSILPI